MSFYHGKSARFFIDNAAGSLTDISTGMTDVSLPISADTVEVTGFTDTAKNYVMGLPSANGSISGQYSTTVDTVLAGIAGSSDTKSFEYYPYSTGTGAVLKKGECFVTSYDVKAPIGGQITYSANLIVSGSVLSTVAA
ncbi:MAG: hypothetical protein WC365_00925 [Candidatus Babeliales bacterium]|jgi:hypothetical protein